MTIHFERLAWQAIQTVYNARLADPYEVDQSWLAAVLVVLSRLVTIRDDRQYHQREWPHLIKEELFLLQKEWGLDRRSSVAVLEKRLEAVIREFDTGFDFSSPNAGKGYLSRRTHDFLLEAPPGTGSLKRSAMHVSRKSNSTFSLENGDKRLRLHRKRERDSDNTRSADGTL